MLDVKYYKDYRHNYLIIKDNNSMSENVYQRKMVTENRIKGLLVSQERYINGDILLYYEITSKQSLFSVYGGKRMGMDDLRRLLVQLKIVNDMLQKYLLDGKSLLLMPEYIFQNIETGEYSFLYYPNAEEDSLPGLMDFLISRVDNEDMEAVETVYKLADLVSREQFVLDEALKWFQEDGEGETRESNEENWDQTRESPNDFWQEEQRGKIEKETLEMQREAPKENKSKKIIARFVSVWGVCLVCVGALVYVGYFYELSYEEEIYMTGGWIATAAFMAGSAGWALYTLFFQRKQPQKQKAQEEIQSYAPAYESSTQTPASDIGNTVYIPWTENCENKLYCLDRKKKCHIDLGSLPLTVGKLAGAVDMVLDESSVSRMHAKFSREGNKIYITDLNSTNGTFKNGMRLTPNASERIEPGDEIRLGKLKFIYR